MIENVKLGDVATVKGGKRLPKGTNLITTPNSHPYIRVRDLNNQSTLELNDDFEYVDDETQKSIARYIVGAGDIVLSIVGTIGLVAIVGESLHKANLTENCVKLTQLDGVDRDYLYYYLKSDLGQAEIAKGTVGAVQAKLPIKNIQDIDIVLPDISTQQKISSILRSIDDKIENNQKINDNLYAQARAFAKQWIGENNSDYELLLLSEVAVINPNTYSPKAEWEYVNYLDTSSITDGHITDIQHITPSTEKLPSRARRIIASNDVVFSTVRPNQRHFGIISEPLPNMLASTGFAVIRSKNSLVCNELIYLCLTDNAFIEKMQQLAEQSTSTFPSIKPSDLGVCEIPCPKDDSSRNLTETLKTMFTLIAANHRENASLVELRDLLLQRLMSGEIDVSNIQL